MTSRIGGRGLAGVREPPRGLEAALQAAYGFARRAMPVLPLLRERTSRILAHAEELRKLGDESLRAALLESRKRTRLGQRASEENALALLVEMAMRTLGRRPYESQVMGALALRRGFAIQMATGEGKTITAALAGVLASWRGGNCHIVTANDYLARRDALEMDPLFKAAETRVAHVAGGMAKDERVRNYSASVVYATSRELLGDYLRDRIARAGSDSPDAGLIRKVLGQGGTGDILCGLDTAIIDEADSVLADEALTPLIISSPGRNQILRDATLAAHTILESLQAGIHYSIEGAGREVRLTRAGQIVIDAMAESLPAIWRAPSRREELLEQAILARDIYRRDVHYVVLEDRVVLVDEKTGRLLHGHTWSYGLNQAVEAKEGIAISDPSEVHTRMSFQNFFRLYRHLSGMSGTIHGLESEFWAIYRLPVLRLPPRVPLRLRLHAGSIHGRLEEKWEAVAGKVLDLQNHGRPVLVGTRSIKDSEAFASRLRNRGVECQVLNALRHEEEAAVIAHAGEPGRVTIATNMAGRGTDIRLPADSITLGGLFVIATERYESRRIDWQLFGRAGRQGQPGDGVAILSLEDEIVARSMAPLLRRLFSELLRSGALGQRCVALIFPYLQRRLERRAARIRTEMLLRDYRMEEMLSFAGSHAPGRKESPTDAL